MAKRLTMEQRIEQAQEVGRQRWNSYVERMEKQHEREQRAAAGNPRRSFGS